MNKMLIYGINLLKAFSVSKELLTQIDVRNETSKHRFFKSVKKKTRILAFGCELSWPFQGTAAN